MHRPRFNDTRDAALIKSQLIVIFESAARLIHNKLFDGSLRRRRKINEIVTLERRRKVFINY